MQAFMPNEVDTCRMFMVPKAVSSRLRCGPSQIAEQRIVDVVERIMFGRRKHTKPRHGAPDPLQAP